MLPLGGFLLSFLFVVHVVVIFFRKGTKNHDSYQAKAHRGKTPGKKESVWENVREKFGLLLTYWINFPRSEKKTSSLFAHLIKIFVPLHTKWTNVLQKTITRKASVSGKKSCSKRIL
jgi:hypothetical protein